MLTGAHVVVGTPQYMAPEQARGDPIDHRADLFACGVLCYELLAGERFYEGMTANDIWNLIEKDLTEASRDLWKRSEYPQSELGRITKGAAQALLVKTYLWREKWAEAKTIAEEIINSNEYQLMANYADIFPLYSENNAESIFEIQYMNASGGNWGKNNANEGTFTPVFQRARGQFEGYGFNIPTDPMYIMKAARSSEHNRYQRPLLWAAIGGLRYIMCPAAW